MCVWLWMCVCVRVGWRCWSLARGRRLAVSTAACLIRSLSLRHWSSLEFCVVTALVSLYSATHILYTKLSDKKNCLDLIVTINISTIDHYNRHFMYIVMCLNEKRCCPPNVPPVACVLIERSSNSLLGPLLSDRAWEVLAELSWALVLLSVCISLMRVLLCLSPCSPRHRPGDSAGGSR